MDFKIDKGKTCAFTGHRDVEDDFDEGVVKEFIESFIKKGYDAFLCGMARGFDLIAADAVLELKEKYPHIKLIGCVPCPEQDKYYSSAEKKKYARILNACDYITVINDHYFNGCMQMRDRFMVDNCSLLLAHNVKSEGGTYYTLSYAAGKNVEMYVV